MQNLYDFGEFSKEGIRQFYASNPFFILQDQIFGTWFDAWVLLGVKCYYWPAFIAGTSDNIADLLKPQTYSICK